MEIRYDVNCFKVAFVDEQNTSANRTNCNGGGTEALGNGAGAVVAFGVGTSPPLRLLQQALPWQQGHLAWQVAHMLVMTAFSIYFSR